MPIVNAPQTSAATAIQSEGQQRATNATQAPDLNDTLAQGMRTLQSTVVRGSDPVQKGNEAITDNNATKRQDGLQHEAQQAPNSQAARSDDSPVRYVKRPSQPSPVEARRSDAPVSVILEGYEDSTARSLDIKT